MSNNQAESLITPQQFVEQQLYNGESPRGRLLIATCRSGTYLAKQVVEKYKAHLAEKGSKANLLYLEEIDFHFSDTETCVRLEAEVSGYDVFLFQALFDPGVHCRVNENYMAFLIAARTFKEWGANQVTAVLPYLAYARQDKPTRFEREPTTARLMADLTRRSGVDRLITWDPHCDAIRGFYDDIPVNKLTSLALFTQEFGRFREREDVIAVAPDAGAAKLVTHFGRTMGLKSAVASKYRPNPEEAAISEIIGDFAGKRIALVLDDMISSGGTIYVLIKKLVEEKGIEAVYLGVSHFLGRESARQRLLELHQECHLKELMVTNTIPQQAAFCKRPFVTVHNLAETFSRVINRIHYNRPLNAAIYGKEEVETNI